MSDPRPDPDDEKLVKLPEEASLDDLIAGLEASRGNPSSATDQRPAAETQQSLPSEPLPERQERRRAERREPVAPRGEHGGRDGQAGGLQNQ